MKVKCEYCGNYLSDTEEKCPSCMAPNEHLRRVANEVPQTIEELREWYVAHNLPPEDVTRFFIGKDIKAPRAFGIYYDEPTGNYVVYKNKDTGERAVRYEGKDEAYAVNELYMKLKEEILHQKGLNIERRVSSVTPTVPSNGIRIATTRVRPQRRSNRALILIVFIMIIFFVSCALPWLGILLVGSTAKKQGYYSYQDQPYYLYGYCTSIQLDACEWYRYDTTKNEWSRAENVNAKEVKYVGDNWGNYSGIDVTTKIEDSECYKEMHPPVPTTGYYKYNNQIYYYFHGWYIYQNNAWNKSSAPSHEVEMNPDSYYDSSSSSNDAYGFKDSNYYEDYYSNRGNSGGSSYSGSGSNDSYYDNDSSWSSSSNDSWDSGSSWDSSDSWDSGSTDWGSDW